MRQRQFDSKDKEKPKPDRKPTTTQVRALLHSDDQHKFDDICAAFRMRMFIGKLVVQWCGKCGKWRPQYVPQEKVDAIRAERKARPFFVPEPETFPCMGCGRKLILEIDTEHTILESK